MSLALIGQVLLLAAIFGSGLVRRYPGFVVWAFASAVKSAILIDIALRLGFAVREYITAWQWLERLSTVTLLWAGYEAYRLTIRNYPGFAGSYGRRTLLAAVALATTIALLPFAFEGAGFFWHKPVWIMAMLMRTATLTVGVGLAVAVYRVRGILVRIDEPPNLINHRRLIVIYCAGQAIGLGLLAARFNIGWVALHLSVTAGCWLAWPVAITRKGDTAKLPELSEEERFKVQARYAGLRRGLGQAVASPRSRRIASR